MKGRQLRSSSILHELIGEWRYCRTVSLPTPTPTAHSVWGGSSWRGCSVGGPTHIPHLNWMARTPFQAGMGTAPCRKGEKRAEMARFGRRCMAKCPRSLQRLQAKSQGLLLRRSTIITVWLRQPFMARVSDCCAIGNMIECKTYKAYQASVPC